MSVSAVRGSLVTIRTEKTENVYYRNEKYSGVSCVHRDVKK